MADTFSGDDGMPGESDDPTQAGHPDEDPELGPAFKERGKPRRKRGGPEESPEEVTIYQISQHFKLPLLVLTQ